MRRYQKIAILMAAACAAGQAHAQPGKYSAAIRFTVETRSGAAWGMQATGKLNPGEQVIVHHEDGPWAAILPPTGSVSWVNHRFLGEFDPNGTGKQNALTMAEGVEIRLGSDPQSPPLAVTQIKLPRGTWVEIVGPKLKDGGSTWYPITPPEGEYRWVPKEALGPPQPLTPPPVFVRSDSASSPTLAAPVKTTGSLTSTASTRPAAVTTQSANWDRAELAERAGDFVTAEKIYTLIYQDLRQKQADPETLLVCYNRIIKCQDRIRLDATSARPSLTPPVLAEGARSPASLQSPTGSNGSVVGAAWPDNKSNLTSTGSGSLRRAGFLVDGKQAYALESSKGEVLYYVTAEKNVGLEAFVNRQVELLGNVQVRGDIRGGQYMVVSRVANSH